MFQRRVLLNERMNEQPGTFVLLTLEPPFLTSECVSLQPSLFLAGHLTGLDIRSQGEKSKNVSLEQSHPSPSPSEGKFTSWGRSLAVSHVL